MKPRKVTITAKLFHRRSWKTLCGRRRWEDTKRSYNWYPSYYSSVRRWQETCFHIWRDTLVLKVSLLKTNQNGQKFVDQVRVSGLRMRWMQVKSFWISLCRILWFAISIYQLVYGTSMHAIAEVLFFVICSVGNLSSTSLTWACTWLLCLMRLLENLNFKTQNWMFFFQNQWQNLHN